MGQEKKYIHQVGKTGYFHQKRLIYPYPPAGSNVHPASRFNYSSMRGPQWNPYQPSFSDSGKGEIGLQRMDTDEGCSRCQICVCVIITLVVMIGIVVGVVIGMTSK